MKKKANKKVRQLRLKGISGIKIKPTEQDIKIAAGLAAGKKKNEALVEAGVSPENARSNSAEILARPGVRAALAIALDRANVNLDRVATVLNEGLSATRIIEANLLVMVDANGKTKQEFPCKDGYIDATGEGVQKEFVRVEDYAVRHKYLETGIKLLDLLPSEGKPVGEISPFEEQNMIAAAEAAASQRDITRYTVTRERSKI